MLQEGTGGNTPALTVSVWWSHVSQSPLTEIGNLKINQGRIDGIILIISSCNKRADMDPDKQCTCAHSGAQEILEEAYLSPLILETVLQS